MRDLIKKFKFTKETSQTEIEETLLKVPDFSYSYYCIQRMNCNSYCEAAIKIYNYLRQT